MREHQIKDAKVQKRSRMPLWRIGAFAALVVVVLIASGWFLKPVLWPRNASATSAQTGPGGSQVVSIMADMAGFSVKEIRAKVGQPLTVQLTSMDNQYHMDGGGKHQFAIDALSVNITAPPEGTAEATFTPTKPGTYEFYCDICCGGRANPSMVGKLIVES
jgi:plastocyanin